MVPKNSARPTASFLLISVLIILTCSWQCYADTEETAAVRPEAFVVGVIHPAQRRYHVKDIKIGEVSVLSLFRKIPREDPGWFPAGGLRLTDVRLSLPDGNLEALRRILIAHRDKPVVEVVMRDAWNPFRRKVPHEYRIKIPVIIEITPCDKVTRVIYEKVVSKLIKEKNEQSLTKRETDTQVDINELFDKLRNNKEIESYMDTLDLPTDAPCVKTIHLLKKSKEEKKTRFEPGEYTLSEDMKQGLKLIIDAMATEPGWWKTDVTVKVTGFTDAVEVQQHLGEKVQISETGIGADAWSRINNRFEVYYSGCDKNKLRVKDRAVYLSFDGGKGELYVGDEIDNNWEFGAVRAYVAMVYLTNVLGRDNPEDSYAPGGIYSGADARKNGDDDQKRRVHVEIIMRAAKQDE
jgi:flagellar motor protein MotB